MGDDATIHARPRLSPAVPGAPLGDLGDLGDLDKKTSPRATGAKTRYSLTRGDEGSQPSPRTGTPTYSSTPPGTLARKKSYHPDLRTASASDCPASTSERREFVLPSAGVGHKMELIHLNRTCTSIDLSTSKTASNMATRCISDANLTDEEKVHRVRHQVSFAHDIGPAGHTVHGEDLLRALRCRVQDDHHGDDSELERDEEDDEHGLGDEDDSSFAYLDIASKPSPDSDKDYLAVRPSLASTQLNEVRGPN